VKAQPAYHDTVMVQVMRSEPYCEKVDVYSYGSVLFYMCTGEKPLDGKTQQDFLFAAQRRQHLLPDVTQIGYRPLADMMFRCDLHSPAFEKRISSFKPQGLSSGAGTGFRLRDPAQEK